MIDIRDSTSRETVLAALQLSAQKWGTFNVHGDEQVRLACVALAVGHGVKIANPELQQAIASDRARLRVEREHQPIPKPVAQSIAEAYRLHLADVSGKATPPVTRIPRASTRRSPCASGTTEMRSRAS